jgi:hypothetical protein
MAFLGAALAAGAGCSSDPANVAGTYTLAVTNGKNECDITPYTVGATASGIAATFTQTDSTVTADFGGSPLAAFILSAWLNSDKFEGTVDGNDLDLKITGSQPKSKGNCAYTINARATATIDGDVLVGQIDYTAATNENPDCGTLVGCHTVQDFNGTRPPSSN